MVAVLGNVPMSQFIKIQISEELCKGVEVLIGISLELASVRRSVFAHVDLKCSA